MGRGWSLGGFGDLSGDADPFVAADVVPYVGEGEVAVEGFTVHGAFEGDDAGGDGDVAVGVHGDVSVVDLGPLHLAGLEGFDILGFVGGSAVPTGVGHVVCHEFGERFGVAFDVGVCPCLFGGGDGFLSGGLVGLGGLRKAGGGERDGDREG